MHVFGFVAPKAVLYMLAKQREQSTIELPGLPRNVPAGHDAQEEPETYRPAAHVVGVVGDGHGELGGSSL